MNLSTVKWAQWDKTHFRELSGLFICVCIALCTTVAHHIAQNRMGPECWSSTIVVLRNLSNYIPTVNLPGSWRRFRAHHQRLVPVLFKDVEDVHLVAALVRQRVGSRVDATKHPHLMSVQRTGVIRQRRRTPVHLPQTNNTTTILRPFFRDHLGNPVPEENFWTSWCKGRLPEADTLTIRLGTTPSRLTTDHLHHPPTDKLQQNIIAANN